MSDFLYTLWVGFCHLLILIMILSIMGVLFLGGVWALSFSIVLAFHFLGKVGIAILLILGISYLIGKKIT